MPGVQSLSFEMENTLSNNTEGGDSTVLSTTNKDDALMLRSDLMKNFDKLWVYVYNSNNETFDVKVANNWGSKIEPVMLKAIEKFILDKKLVPATGNVVKKAVKKEKLD